MISAWCDSCGSLQTPDPDAPNTPNGVPLCPVDGCGLPLIPYPIDPLNLTDTIEGGIA